MSLELTRSDSELRESFLALKSVQDLADLLEIDYSRLVYHLYVVPPEDRYRAFSIAKRHGGERAIHAPATALGIIQTKLNQVLRAVYVPRPCVHGFAVGKSIESNARAHCAKRYVLSVDLSDFFPSINFGRVRGLFIAPPYRLRQDVATVIAQICCHDNALPQGASTSPVVSNMICGRMDRELQRLARSHRCFYTRYADDITFSTSCRDFPSELAVQTAGRIAVGDELQAAIEGNGFSINRTKVLLRTRGERQEVTGLTVNRFPNVKRQLIRQVRAMLHAWRKYGLEAAQDDFRSRWDSKQRRQSSTDVSFTRVVRGKIEFIGMVRGRDDQIYRRLLTQYAELAGLPRPGPTDAADDAEPLVRVSTEGKSDWKHLKAALRWLQAKGEFTDLRVAFDETDEDMDWSKLLQRCGHLGRYEQRIPHVAVFDRDVAEAVKKAEEQGKPLKAWGHNVYSLVLPVPAHRRETPEVCIELYYKDDEIRQADGAGRRLYLSSEFESETGFHLDDSSVVCHALSKLRGPLSVIDDQVFTKGRKDLALSKEAFALNTLEQAEGFANFDFSPFAAIFGPIESLLAKGGRAGKRSMKAKDAKPLGNKTREGPQNS